MTAGLLAGDSLSAAGLRPIDSRRDLAQVADLIEEVFRGELDSLARRMVREMRALGKAGWLGWTLNRLLLPPAARPQGFVWEEAGRLVGNSSLLAVGGYPERWVLANVAVRPGYRRRGIGRQMVAATIELAIQRGAAALFLQVQPDNLPALQLYQGLGFERLSTRTSWRRVPGRSIEPAELGLRIRPRRKGEWERQWELASGLFPEGLNWPFPLDPQTFRASATARRRHWLAWERDQLMGSVTLREGRSSRLILLVPPAFQGQVERDLLAFGLSVVGSRKPVAVEYPAGVATGALEQLGFRPERTLTWMRRWLGGSRR